MHKPLVPSPAPQKQRIREDEGVGEWGDRKMQSEGSEKYWKGN